MTRIAVLGCGHGGQALAAHLTLNGCDVALYAHPEYAAALYKIQETQEITLFGAMSGTAKISLLTTDLKTAVYQRDIIYIVLPTYAHDDAFIEMLPHLAAGQIVVTLASNFSSLVYRQIQETQQCFPKIILVDMPSIPYACRAESPGYVNIIALKETQKIAALPATKTEFAINQLQAHFPSKLLPSQSVIEVGMNITNGTCHPIVALFNVGRIGENKAPFYFYKDGITLEIAGLIEKIDNDRLEIGKRLGYKLPGLLELMLEYYGNSFDTVYDFFRHSPVHNAAPLCPPSLNARYFTEDIAYLLVPWFNIGLLVGYHSDALHAVIQLAAQLMQINHLQEGRTLAKMGLLGKTPEEALALIHHGESA